MTWGVPTDTFLQIHVALSLIGIASGLLALLARAAGKSSVGGMTGLFLLTTTLTNVTGFPLPPFGLDPPRIIGIISLALLAAAIFALYIERLAGGWRAVYLVCAAAALQLNIFVAIVQAFQKLPSLQPLAPTQSEPPFVIAQVVALAIVVALTIRAFLRFHLAVVTPAPGE